MLQKNSKCNSFLLALFRMFGLSHKLTLATFNFYCVITGTKYSRVDQVNFTWSTL